MNTCDSVDLSRLMPLSEMKGDSEDDTELLKTLAENAKQFIYGFPWCGGIKHSYFGFGIGGIVAIFLFQIDSISEEVDECLWIVVGDLPPAYLVTDRSPNPVSAMNVYLEEMKAWVAAVEAGKSVDDLIPVNVSPTLDSALALKGRLCFLEETILPMIA